MAIQVLFQDQNCEMKVEADLELEDLLSRIRTELGLSGEAELEQYEEDLGKWMTVTDTEDLELKAGAKYRVQSATEVHINYDTKVFLSFAPD